MDLDRIRGGYLGLCLGDALGVPFESGAVVKTYSGILQHPVIVRSRWQGTRTGPPGQVSDDSTMTTALLHCIITDRDWIQDHVIKAYLDWANQPGGYAFMGKNTRQVLVGVRTVQGFLNRLARLSPVSQSNGSLMRAFPLILLYYWQPQSIFQKAIADTSLTNPNPVNQDATLIYLLILRAILSNRTAESALPEIIQQSQTPVIRESLIQAQNRTIRMVDGEQKGWVANALYMAVRAWMMTDNPNTRFPEIIEWVISRGGDTDTNASIAGAIVGTYYGERRLRQDQVTEQNIGVLLGSNPYSGQIPYDIKYHPSVGLNLLI